jgi:BirA family transcriptional regulator, biotin operon repressor / biotin---[acetyl-CoA-carboxylase] ligase
MIDVVRILRETSVARAEHHPTLDSTNDRAAWCAAHGAKELPLVVVADQQTAGRGRGSNRWWTGPGGLAFSLLVDAETVAADASRSPLVALAAAVALAEAVAALLPDHTVGIHWPNDVLAARRKVAGILVEVLADRRHVIGIGLNLNSTLADAPPELRATAGTLRDLSGRHYDPTETLIDLLRRLEREFGELRRDGAAVARRANGFCLERDRLLTLQLGDREITGQCRGIAADGAILLETPAGVQAFFSGALSLEL